MNNPTERLERLLSGLRRAGAPVGLRDRLLRNVAARRRRERVMTPRLWKAAAGSLALAALIIAGDLLMTRREQATLAAIAGSAVESRESGESTALAQDQVLAEVFTTGEQRLLFELSGISSHHRTPGPSKWIEWLRLEPGILEEDKDGA